MTKGKVPVGRATNIKGVGIGELRLITVGRADMRQHHLTGLDLLAADFDERDGFGVAGLEADRSAGGDVETETVGLCAVEGEEGVGFDEVVVGADLMGWRGKSVC